MLNIIKLNAIELSVIILSTLEWHFAQSYYMCLYAECHNAA
jgi:hypothetical protein